MHTGNLASMHDAPAFRCGQCIEVHHPTLLPPACEIQLYSVSGKYVQNIQSGPQSEKFGDTCARELRRVEM